MFTKDKKIFFYSTVGEILIKSRYVPVLLNYLIKI